MAPDDPFPTEQSQLPQRCRNLISTFPSVAAPRYGATKVRRILSFLLEPCCAGILYVSFTALRQSPPGNPATVFLAVASSFAILDLLHLTGGGVTQDGVLRNWRLKIGLLSVISSYLCFVSSPPSVNAEAQTTQRTDTRGPVAPGSSSHVLGLPPEVPPTLRLYQSITAFWPSQANCAIGFFAPALLLSIAGFLRLASKESQSQRTVEEEDLAKRAHLDSAENSDNWKTSCMALFTFLPAAYCALMLYLAFGNVWVPHGDTKMIFFYIGCSLSIVTIFYMITEYERAVTSDHMARAERVKVATLSLAMLLCVHFSLMFAPGLQSAGMTAIIWGIAAITPPLGCYTCLQKPQEIGPTRLGRQFNSSPSVCSYV